MELLNHCAVGGVVSGLFPLQFCLVDQGTKCVSMATALVQIMQSELLPGPGVEHVVQTYRNAFRLFQLKSRGFLMLILLLIMSMPIIFQ